jgi:AcrR family transcriptional regulator
MHRGSETKELIEKTALHLFVKRGITETTIRHIASAADIAEGTMYRHFSSKDELAWEIFSKNFLGFSQELNRIQKAQKGLRKKLEMMIRFYCTFFDDDPILFSYLFLFALHGQVRKVSKDMPHPMVILQKVLAEGMKRREIKKRDSNVAAAMVGGMLLQTATSIVYGRIKKKMTSLADEMIEASWMVLQS